MNDITRDAAQAERTLLAALLEDSRLYHTSRDYLDLLEFVSRLRNFAPFNAMLLRIQKPGLTYAASAWDWKTRFDRTVKEGARPLLILWPFGPVALVYDVLDTEGKPLPADVAETFHATGAVTQETIERFFRLLSRRGIDAKHLQSGDAHAGTIRVIERSAVKGKRGKYKIRINSTHALNVQFVTLAHELGHLFLGHLGSDKYLKIGERPPMTTAQKELEAESLAYLVCKRHGVRSKSESYLAGYVNKNTTVGTLDLDAILKAAGQVETLLGIAAETLFEPKKKRDAEAESDRTGGADTSQLQLHFSSRYA
jgi:hypothetical protein